MTVIAAALRELMAAGVMGDALVTAIERIEVEFVESVEAEAMAADLERKAAAAARQTRYIQRKRQMTSADVSKRHLTSSDVADVSKRQLTSFGSIEEDILSSSSTQSKSKKRKKVSTALSPDWSPSDADIAFAQEKGWTMKQVAEQSSRFRDYALAKDRHQADWAAAWRNWVTSPYQQNGKGHRNGAGNGLMEALDYAIDRAGGDEIEGNPPMVDVTPRRP